MMIIADVSVDSQLVVTAIAKSCTNHAPCILLRLAIEREHHFGMVRM